MDEESVKPKATQKRDGIRLELDLDVHRRLQRVAKLKKTPYQTLLKQFVGERLYEEEKRMGVI